MSEQPEIRPDRVAGEVPTCTFDECPLWKTSDGDEWYDGCCSHNDESVADSACGPAVRRMAQRLEDIKKHWQEGIGDLNNKWRLEMARLVGDDDGLEEAAKENTDGS